MTDKAMPSEAKEAVKVTQADRIRAEARRLSEEMFSWEDDHLERDIAYGAAFAAILETEKRIVDWLRAEYASSCESQNIPVNAISMIDTIRSLMEEGAHRK